MRHRAKLVAVRSLCKAEVHAVLAKCGVQVPMTDLFGVTGATGPAGPAHRLHGSDRVAAPVDGRTRR